MAPRALNAGALAEGEVAPNAALRLLPAALGRPAMSVRFRTDRERWEVRWRLDNGTHRARLFRTEADAQRFDARMRERRRELTARRAVRQIAPPEKKARQQVYVISAGDTVKIGRATDPIHRLNGMQIGSPVDLRLLWCIVCPDAHQLEASLHARYAEHKVRGEWYRAAPVVADLTRLADLGPCWFEDRGATEVELACADRAPGLTDSTAKSAAA